MAMTIVRTFEAKGWTVVDYDKLMERITEQLALAPGRSAPGVLFHWAAETADGMRAVDVYESRAAADQLVGETIGPLAGELGLSLPEITELEVHNWLRA
jgi:hypothetical protein